MMAAMITYQVSLIGYQLHFQTTLCVHKIVQRWGMCGDLWKWNNDRELSVLISVTFECLLQCVEFFDLKHFT